MSHSIAVPRQGAATTPRRPGGGVLPGISAMLAGVPRWVTIALLAFALLVPIVARYDAVTALVLTLALAGAIGLLLWPEVATLLMVFLLYTNIPAVAARQHGVPRLVAGSFLLLLAIPLASFTVARGERLRMDRTLAWMLLFLGVLLLTSLNVEGLAFAADRIVTFAIEGLVLYWLVLNVVRTLPTLRRVLWTIVAAGATLGGLTFYQEATGAFHQQFGGLAHRNYEYVALQRGLAADPDNPEVQAQIAEVLRRTDGERSSRAEGPVDEPNRFAQILIVLLPIMAYLFRTSTSPSARLVALVLGGATLSGIVFSYSRGALVAIVVLAAMALTRKWIRPVHLLIGALLLTPLLPAAAPKLVERARSIVAASSLLGGTPSAEVDGAIRGRATEMMAAFQAFLDHPVLGVGPGQYRPFYSEEYHAKNPRLAFRDIEGSRRAHTLYLELAAELGVVGLIVFLAIVVLLMRELAWMRRRFASRSEFSDLAIALQLSLVAYLTTAVFLHLAYERYFWFLLAVAGAGLQIARRTEQALQRQRHTTAGLIPATQNGSALAIRRP